MQLIIETIKDGHTYFICGLTKHLDVACVKLIMKYWQDFPILILEIRHTTQKQCFDYFIQDNGII